MEQTRLLHGKPASSPELNSRSVLPTAEQLEESAILAHCQLGVRAVLAPLIGTYLYFWSGLGLTVILSLLRCLLVVSPSRLPPWLCVIPLLLGCALGFFTPLRSFNRLRVFLFVPPPPEAHLSRAAFASSRREKIPFALLWLRFSAQAAAGSLAVVFSAVLLASHFEQASSVNLSIALAPVAVFATLNVFHGLLCKGGSWLRLFAACAALAQLWLLAAPTTTSDPTTHLKSWNQRLLPSFVMLALVSCMLLRHLFVYHSWHMSTGSSGSNGFVSSITCVQDAAHRMRALSPPQACVGWTYLIGALLSLAGLYCLALALDKDDHNGGTSDDSNNGRWHAASTACVLLLSSGGALFVVGGWAAVVRWAAALEVYTGDQDPLPVYQDAESGEWGVPGEEPLCIEGGGDAGVEGCGPATGGCGIQPLQQGGGDYTSCCGCTDPSCLAPHVEGAVHWWRTAIVGWAPELEEAPLLGPHPTRFSYPQTNDFSLRQPSRSFGGANYFGTSFAGSNPNSSARPPPHPNATDRGGNSAAAVSARTALGRAAGGLPLDGHGQAPLRGSYQRSGGDVRI